jgi:hypothetical protein
MRYKVGKAIVEITDSPTRIGVAVALSGILAGLLEYSVHVLVKGGNTPESVQAVVDAVIVGFAVAGVVFLLLLSSRERRRRVVDDIRKIAELNHHVRNALQVVVDSQYVPQSLEQREAVLASVDRIDKTLRELFPVIGEREEDSGGGVRSDHQVRVVFPNRRR